MEAYNRLTPHLSYDTAPSMLYETESGKWFVTTSVKSYGSGLNQITEEQAESFLTEV
jgi:hypothetical protein